MHNKLLLLSIVSFLAGVALETTHANAWVVSYGCILLAAIFSGAWFFGKRDRYVFPALTVLFLALGLVRGHFIDTGERAELEALVDAPVSFTGTISAPPDVRESTERLTIDTKEYHTRIIVVVSRYANFHYGDVVSVSGTLSRPKLFDTDGGRSFAYDKYLEKDGIAYLVNYGNVEEQGKDTSIGIRVLAPLYKLREVFDQGLAVAFTEPAASLASGILLGGKAGLGKELLDAFTATGLLPVIVLSGYNIMIVAQALFILLRRAPRNVAYGIAGVVSIAFVIATGGGTSGVRALLMTLIALSARATGRSYQALRALIGVITLMVLWNPLLLVYDTGFQFSCAATLGLILFSTPLAYRLRKIKNATFRDVLATTLAAQVFVLPLLLYQTGNLSVFAIIANALVLPVVPLAMLLSFIAGLMGLFIPSLAALLSMPAWFLLFYIMAVAETIAKIPFARIIVPAFPAWVLLPAYFLVMLLVRRLRLPKQSAALQPSN